ncbi:chromosome segregation ATPase [Drosophila suzukii associated hytrosavirus 1]|nr:chromosome segregation ATPase [Drosophila suzukii associated hytrosavirus 1]
MSSISDIITDYPKIRSKYFNVLEQIQTPDKQIAVVSQDIVQLKTILQTTEEKNVQLNRELIRLQESIAEKNSQLLIAEEKNIQLTEEIKRLQQQLSEKNFNSMLQLNYEELQASYENLLEQHQILTEEKKHILTFLIQQFNLRSTSIDDIMSQLQRIIMENNQMLSNYELELSALRSTVEGLEMSTGEKERRVRKTIETLNNSIISELDNIDVELEMYNATDDKFNSNPLKLEEFVNVDNYNVASPIQRQYLPLLELISVTINEDMGEYVNDFEGEEQKNNINLYHAYMIFLVKLLSIFSKKYMRNYLESIYNMCIKASETPEKIVKVPRLVMPQSFQTNSLYFLMNRYNSKAYDPDRVLDFGDFLFNFVKPEFRPDTTKALNLFQPGIGKRYNSILIYTPETMKNLRQLRDNLETMALPSPSSKK